MRCTRPQLSSALFWNQDVDAVVRRELTPEMLLPAGSEEQIHAGYVGVLGAFEIYRGKPRGHRMANLRLVLR